ELKMKNYGESGTFGSIIINKELTPYVSYRNVKHSEEYKTDVPAFDGETGGKFKVNTPINVRVKSPDWISVYYTTDGSTPTEKSAKVNNGIITWTPTVVGEYIVKIAAVEGIRLMSDVVQSSRYIINNDVTVTLVNEDGNGKAYFDGDETKTVKSIAKGESAIIHAKANANYEFGGWTMRKGGIDTPLDKKIYPADMTLNNIDADVTFIAHFTFLDGVDILGTEAINIYANSGAIYINGFSGIAHIYNIAGQIIKEVNVSETATVKVGAGVYFVKINGRVTRVVVR
ncbi:MAG: chitobiase/beta-hexosaminidase C-terminal domain-containing protein, partial [Bacteroidales bacterium]